MGKGPKIILTSQDLDRLDALLEGLPADAFPDKTELMAELDRADVVEPQEVPPDVVTMNSTARFELESGEDFSLTLVYPKDKNGSADRISILAPVGGALLGCCPWAGTSSGPGRGGRYDEGAPCEGGLPTRAGR